ncbi:MAG TPA: hypothetical protein VI431_03795, partial [Candidatus Acidoferrum sp.]
MNHLKIRAFFVVTPVLAVILSGALALRAQEPPQEPTKEAIAQAPDLRHRVDGERHGLPLETFAVTPGTKFLVSLQDELGTKGAQENATFKVKTLEPLEAGSGFYLPSGAEIIGHISRVEP